MKNSKYTKTVDKGIGGFRKLVTEVHKDFEIYRFRPVNNYTIRQLFFEVFTLSNANTFNDPYDCYAFVDSHRLTESQTNTKMTRHNHLLNEELRSVNSEFVIAMKNFFYIASMSSRLRKTSLWAHYADKSRGFAIGYSVIELQKIIDEYEEAVVNEVRKKNLVSDDVSDDKIRSFIHRTQVYFGPVDYQRKDFDVTDIVIRLQKNVDSAVGLSSVDDQARFILSHASDEDFIDDLQQFKNKIILKKSTDWKYEDEWRFCLHLNFEGLQYYDFTILKPSRIYLGEFISDSDKKLICGICYKNNTPVYQMYTSRSANINKLSYKKISRKKLEIILNEL